MAFFLSGFAGGMVAQVLAVETGASEEYILVLHGRRRWSRWSATLVFFIAQFFGNAVKAVNIVGRRAGRACSA